MSDVSRHSTTQRVSNDSGEIIQRGERDADEVVNIGGSRKNNDRGRLLGA